MKLRESINWERLSPKMCCRCNKEATHKFEKKTLFTREEKHYCDKHILERTMQEKVQ